MQLNGIVTTLWYPNLEEYPRHPWLCDSKEDILFMHELAHEHTWQQMVLCKLYTGIHFYFWMFVRDLFLWQAHVTLSLSDAVMEL